MNEKFFDLKKEKQDRMINASLKIFAQNGYAHASTDDIVKEAGISKGLLFHYFGSKIGLYSFIYDYSAKFVSLEMTSTVNRSDNDYFSLHLQIINAQCNVMKGYPYMIAFLNSTKNENVLEAMKEIADKKNIVPDKVEEYFKHANTYLVKPQLDVGVLTQMINLCEQATLKEAFEQNGDVSEFYTNKMKDYLMFLKTACYQE